MLLQYVVSEKCEKWAVYSLGWGQERKIVHKNIYVKIIEYIIPGYCPYKWVLDKERGNIFRKIFWSFFIHSMTVLMDLILDLLPLTDGTMMRKHKGKIFSMKWFYCGSCTKLFLLWGLFDTFEVFQTLNVILCPSKESWLKDTACLCENVILDYVFL